MAERFGIGFIFIMLILFRQETGQDWFGKCKTWFKMSLGHVSTEHWKLSVLGKLGEYQYKARQLWSVLVFFFLQIWSSFHSSKYLSWT